MGTGSRGHVGTLSASFLTEFILRSSKLEKNPEEDEGWKQFADGAKVYCEKALKYIALYRIFSQTEDELSLKNT